MKYLSIILGLMLVIGIGIFVFMQSRENASAPRDQNMQNQEASVPTQERTGNTSATEGFSMEDVAEHAGENSCWSAINGSVYDLTSWIPKHPGGSQAILRLCGKDGSDAFNRQHGGRAMQQQILDGYKIGVVR